MYGTYWPGTAVYSLYRAEADTLGDPPTLLRPIVWSHFFIAGSAPRASTGNIFHDKDNWILNRYVMFVHNENSNLWLVTNTALARSR